MSSVKYEEAMAKAGRFLDGRTRINNENIIIVNMATASESDRDANTVRYVNKVYYIEKIGDADNLLIIHSVDSEKTFCAPIGDKESEALFLRNMLRFEKKNGVEVVDGSETILFGGTDNGTKCKFRSNAISVCLNLCSIAENQKALDVFNGISQPGETDLRDLVIMEGALNSPKILEM